MGSRKLVRRWEADATAQIKEAIYGTGAVFVLMHMASYSGSPYYHMNPRKGETTSEEVLYARYPNYWAFDAGQAQDGDWIGLSTNHAVTIVGWDDEYSRWNFATPLYDDEGKPRAYDYEDIACVEEYGGTEWIVPVKDGAWLVKNSWGTGDSETGLMGDEGMFYFSYCEKTIMYPSVFIPDNDSEGSSYEIVQQYDGVAPEALTLTSPGATECANVFTAKEDQVVEAVGAWSPVEAMDLSLKVYVDLTDPSNPESGTLVAQQSGFYPYEGFRTIKLDSPVSVDAGETYSIVMSFKKDAPDGSQRYYLPAECEIFLPEQCYSSAGESFIESADDSGQVMWVDMFDVAETSGMDLGNVCIKAYANPAPEPDPDPEPEPGEYPSEFDLRDEGLVTSVKMQNPWGTCWAFGSLASLESTVLKDGGSYEGAEPNYSERQLAWVGRTAVGDETDPAQAGEGSYTVRTDAGAGLSDSALVLNGGEDFGIAAAALAAWEGAANEADIPYTNRDGAWSVDMTPETAGDWSIDDDQRSLSAVHVQDVDIIPGTATFEDPAHPSTDGYIFNEEALDTVKQLLMDEGAVGVFYYADASWPNQATGESDYMNYWTWAQYVYQYGTVNDPSTEVVEDTRPNHLVTIVGWDDSYDKENFSNDPVKQPPADGAWIVKNSWGDSSLGPDWAWGLDDDGDGLGDGYFYLSYYDMTVAQFASFRGDTPDADGSFGYDSNYQYDYLGIGSVCKVEPGSFGDAAAANVFTAEGDESLCAVSAVTTESGSTVKVQVYLLDESAQSPTDGVLVATQTEDVALSGYHTIELDQPVKLSAGQRFAVVESVDSAQGAYLPLEVAGWDPADPDEAVSEFTVKKQQTAVANAGESFYSTDGGTTWNDASSLGASDLRGRVSLTMFGGDPEILGVGNAMIKAFTVDGEASTTPVLPGGSGGLADTGDPLALGAFLTCAIAAAAATTALVARRKR